ncbi:hypothetical protein QTN47_21100 [Danxiaibacter flavus]|uniref:Uncharacterized protein n=1 Tax=Danxiaibacter flavus TaxID=3049108 RepID=A0ABV3ZKD2_9BACT|nr:hypothetical protein QNM32_21105 [Chitinophagaceae bacterium DXS]
MILQPSLADATEKFNETTILTQLNESNIFDIEMLHQDGDTLQLHFTLNANWDKYIVFPGDGNSLVYEFKFKKRVWKRSQYDPFKVNFDELQQRKIVRPFQKK